MPNRIIRDGFVDSESVSSLSDWAHRVYTNLLVRCDDAGRFDGRLEYIRSQLFPLGSPKRIEDFRKALTELAAPKDEEGKPLPALIIQYDHAGKPFIQLTKVARSSPCVTSRYPWTDGDHKIAYIKRSTRDGEKEFVVSSLLEGLCIPSVSHANGSGGLSRGCTETGTGTKTETKADTFLFSASPSAKPAEVIPDITVRPSETAAAKPKKGARVLTDEQLVARKAFIDWWTLEAFPSVMDGIEYPFGAEPDRNGKAVSALMKSVGHVLEAAKRVAIAYLRAPDDFIAKQGRPLYGLTNQLTKWTAMANSPRGFTNGANFGKQRPTAEQRGECPKHPKTTDPPIY